MILLVIFNGVLSGGKLAQTITSQAVPLISGSKGIRLLFLTVLGPRHPQTHTIFWRLFWLAPTWKEVNMKSVFLSLNRLWNNIPYVFTNVHDSIHLCLK